MSLSSSAILSQFPVPLSLFLLLTLVSLSAVFCFTLPPSAPYHRPPWQQKYSVGCCSRWRGEEKGVFCFSPCACMHTERARVTPASVLITGNYWGAVVQNRENNCHHVSWWRFQHCSTLSWELGNAFYQFLWTHMGDVMNEHYFLMSFNKTKYSQGGEGQTGKTLGK